MVLEKTKKFNIWICVVLYWKFQLLNSLAEAVPKLFVRKPAFGSKHFWAQPLPLEFLAGISLQSSISYIEFQLLSTKPWFYVPYLYYSLTPVSPTPCINHFWATKNSINKGKTVMVLAAIISGHLIPYAPPWIKNCLSPAEIKNFSGLFVINEGYI